MELNGALWNPVERDKTLELGKFVDKVLSRRRRRKVSGVPPRAGEVKQAVIATLELATQPMTMTEVHLACQELLGRPVSTSTIKDCLHKHARGDQAIFKRVKRGLYVAEAVPAGLLVRRQRHPGSGPSPEATN